MYVIKKNSGSIRTPWLYWSAYFGKYFYGSLKDILEEATRTIRGSKGTHLVVFEASQEARIFISEHSDVCNAENVIYEIKFILGGGMEIVP